MGKVQKPSNPTRKSYFLLYLLNIMHILKYVVCNAFADHTLTLQISEFIYCLTYVM
jgi:hypothetical protein